MTTITSPNQKETANNRNQPFDEDAQTARGENAVYPCPQNDELSSIDVGSRQKEGTFLPRSRCNDSDDIEARIKANPRIVTIPVDLLEKLASDFSLGGHLDSPGEMGHNGICSKDKQT